jgi:CheY-like chemotaxis protein
MSWHVLVVDDDDNLRETLASVLDARGYRTATARNGRDAIDGVLARGTRPSVVVIDLEMPVMDGEAFLASQHAHPLLASVPALVVTARSPLPATLPGHVREVFAKPVRLAALLDSIQIICGRIATSSAAQPSARRARRPSSEDV